MGEVKQVNDQWYKGKSEHFENHSTVKQNFMFKKIIYIVLKCEE